MNRIAKFEKVSLHQFDKDWQNTMYKEGEQVYGKIPVEIINRHEDIKLPQRATKGSAGYDIFSPIDFTLKRGESIKIPTGIRVSIAEGWVLQIYPRSGLGFKYRLQLDNCVGIVDEDYYCSDNEGHIFVKLTNDSRDNKTVEIKEGQAICQGIFVPYGITIDDRADGIRNGGFGSTTKER